MQASDWSINCILIGNTFEIFAGLLHMIIRCFFPSNFKSKEMHLFDYHFVWQLIVVMFVSIAIVEVYSFHYHVPNMPVCTLIYHYHVLASELFTHYHFLSIMQGFLGLLSRYDLHISITFIYFFFSLGSSFSSAIQDCWYTYIYSMAFPLNTAALYNHIQFVFKYLFIFRWIRWTK